MHLQIFRKTYISHFEASSLVQDVIMYLHTATRSTSNHTDDWLNNYCVAWRDQYPFVDEDPPKLTLVNNH